MHWCCEFESRSGRGVQHYVIKFASDLRQVCCGVKPDDGQMGFQLSPFDNHPDLNKNKFYMKFN
jgi:hypothetical protein